MGSVPTVVLVAVADHHSVCREVSDSESASEKCCNQIRIQEEMKDKS